MHQLTVAVIVVVCFSAVLADHDHNAHYHFDYAVHDPNTGDKKAQTETRDGKIVKGSYTFKEADGTRRIVEYEAGPHSGFQALVKRVGHAEHPHHAESHVGITHWGHF